VDLREAQERAEVAEQEAQKMTRGFRKATREAIISRNMALMNDAKVREAELVIARQSVMDSSVIRSKVDKYKGEFVALLEQTRGKGEWLKRVILEQQDFVEKEMWPMIASAQTAERNAETKMLCLKTGTEVTITWRNEDIPVPFDLSQKWKNWLSELKLNDISFFPPSDLPELEIFPKYKQFSGSQCYKNSAHLLRILESTARKRRNQLMAAAAASGGSKRTDFLSMINGEQQQTRGSTLPPAGLGHSRSTGNLDDDRAIAAILEGVDGVCGDSDGGEGPEGEESPENRAEQQRTSASLFSTEGKHKLAKDQDVRNVPI